MGKTYIYPPLLFVFCNIKYIQGQDGRILDLHSYLFCVLFVCYKLSIQTKLSEGLTFLGLLIFSVVYNHIYKFFRFCVGEIEGS